MAATTWHPRTTLSPKVWLLADGSVVTEPALEETSTGRKVRIPGTTLSAFSRDVDELIYQGVQALALKRNTKVWMPLDDQQRRMMEQNYFDSRVTKGHKASLHLLDSSRSRGATTVWWRFRHPTLPVEAMLVCDMQSGYSYRGQGASMTVQTVLLMQSTNPDHANQVTMVHATSSDLSDFWGSLRTAVGHRLRFQELVRDSPPNWYSDFQLNARTVNGERVGVRELLTDVERIDGFDEIDVPDLREPEAPAWLRLNLIDTNCSGEFVQSLKDYLDGESVLGEAVKHYNEMVRLLRSAGLVMPEQEEASFAAALAGGDPVQIEVESKPNEVGHGIDNEHSVVLHLPTGTMIVNCARRMASRDEIAHKWEEAVTMASLTGQEDALLAYARKFAETENERRAKKILDERRNQ